VIWTTNNIVWTTQNSTFGSTNIQSVAYGNGLWFAGGLPDQLRVSTNAITWVTQSPSNPSVYTVAYGNGLWAVGGLAGNLAT
jgi:hypothetical protein